MSWAAWSQFFEIWSAFGLAAAVEALVGGEMG